MSDIDRYHIDGWDVDEEKTEDGDYVYYEDRLEFVAKQAQEIERLKLCILGLVLSEINLCEDGLVSLSGIHRSNMQSACDEVGAVVDWNGLGQLKSRQSGVVLPERMSMPVQSMFSGSPAAYAKAFDTANAHNACLDSVSRLNSSAVSAGSTEVDLQSSGLGYPLAKEQAVQLWHQGFRSEPISVLEAWEAIGHDIGCNPSKEELLDSLRNMSAICRAAFEVEIPEIAATYDGLYLTPVMPLKAGEHLMTIAQHQRIEKQIRAGIAAPGHSEQVREVQGEAVQIEVVAVTREDGDGELYLDWTLEGGISALEFAGQKLLVAHGEVVGEDGSGVIYTAPSPGKQQGEC